LDRRPGSNQ